MPRKSSKQKNGMGMRDGYGAHWHALLWIIVITIFLSTVTLLYSAWAFSSLGTGGASSSNQQLERRMMRLEQRMDSLETNVMEIKSLVQ